MQPETNKPLHVIFWENSLFPSRNSHFSPFIEGLHNYSIHHPIDRGYLGDDLPETRQILQMLANRLGIRLSSLFLNYLDHITIGEIPPNSQLLLITSGDHLLEQLREFEHSFASILVVCDPSKFSRYLAPDHVFVRYYEDVARFPENWWHSDADPDSIAQVKTLVSTIADYGEQLRDMSFLLPYLDNPILLVQLVTLEALKKVVWRNATSPDFSEKKDLLIAELRHLERQQIANNTPNRLQPALCDLQKTIRNIEVGQLASLGRKPLPDAFDKIKTAFESGERDYRRAAVLAFWELGDLKALDVLEPYLSKLIDAMLPYIEHNLPVPVDMREEEAFIREKIHDIRENISPNYWLLRKLLE